MNIIWTFATYYLVMGGRPRRRRDKGMKLVLGILLCKLRFKFNIVNKHFSHV